MHVIIWNHMIQSLVAKLFSKIKVSRILSSEDDVCAHVHLHAYAHGYALKKSKRKNLTMCLLL